MANERITIDQYGLDEIVLDDVDVHLERMDAGVIWLGICRRGNAERPRLSVSFVAKGKSIIARVDENEVGVPETPKGH